LPPLSSEVFTEKVLANKASAAATAAKASFEKLCSACSKTYYSENAYANHLNSAKHKSNLALRARQAPLSEAGDDAASMMSSAFSLISNSTAKKSEVDTEAEDEFTKIVNGIKSTHLEDEGDPLSRRPTRPHHSQADEKREHPLSPTITDSTSTTPSNGLATEKDSSLLRCLFCNYQSPTFALNVHHMSRHHGLFIPEQEFLVDTEGLICHLHAKIGVDHICLFCGKQSHTANGIQTHMRDLGHCMISFDSESDLLDIGQFYDFSSTWSDDGVSESSDSTQPGTGGVKLNSTSQDGDIMDEDGDEGWETDSTLSDVPTDEITSVPIADRSHRYKLLENHRHHSHADPRKHRSADGFHSHAHTTPHAVYYDDYELHLPSGRTAGHRSLNRYYRQNLRNYPTQTEREQRLLDQAKGDSDMEMPDTETVERGRARPADPHSRAVVTRAEGGLGLIGVDDTRKQEIKATERRERRRELKQKNKYQAGNEKRANFQKHYRVSIYFDVTLRDSANLKYRIHFSSDYILDQLRFFSLVSFSKHRLGALATYRILIW
jgi:pre-60S factor REI1